MASAVCPFCTIFFAVRNNGDRLLRRAMTAGFGCVPHLDIFLLKTCCRAQVPFVFTDPAFDFLQTLLFLAEFMLSVGMKCKALAQAFSSRWNQIMYMKNTAFPEGAISLFPRLFLYYSFFA